MRNGNLSSHMDSLTLPLSALGHCGKFFDRKVWTEFVVFGSGLSWSPLDIQHIQYPKEKAQTTVDNPAPFLGYIFNEE